MKHILDEAITGRIGEAKYRTEIQWRNGIFITDELEALGGKDLGPDPMSLLVSSLIACTIATLRMYIDRKAMDIPEITASANLYQMIENGETIPCFEKEIDFHSDLEPEVKARLLKIAGNCPVSKILKGKAVVNTAVK